MLPRVHRLQDRQAFPQIYSRGKRRSGAVLGIAYLPQPSGGGAVVDSRPSQVAVVVSKKVSRKATLRNRVRRQVQAVLYSLLPQLRAGYWIVFSARQPILTCPWQDLQQEVAQLLGRAGLLRDPGSIQENQVPHRENVERTLR